MLLQEKIRLVGSAVETNTDSLVDVVARHVLLTEIIR